MMLGTWCDYFEGKRPYIVVISMDIRSGVDGMSLEVDLFISRHTSQKIRDGMFLITFSLDESHNDAHASLKQLPLHSKLHLNNSLVLSQILSVKETSRNICVTESSTFLLRMHYLGPSLCLFIKLSQFVTLLLIKQGWSHAGPDGLYRRSLMKFEFWKMEHFCVLMLFGVKAEIFGVLSWLRLLPHNC